MLRIALIAASISVSALAFAEEGPLDGFGWFRELAGSCWKGTYLDGATTDTQCYEIQYGRYLRGTIEVEQKGKPPYLGDSVFAYNAKEKRIDYWYWADGGTYGSSEAYVEGKTIRFPAKDSRRIWTQIDRDSFRVEQEKPDGKGWKKVLTVVYARVKK
jgi:hypothetical protein